MSRLLHTGLALFASCLVMSACAHAPVVLDDVRLVAPTDSSVHKSLLSKDERHVSRGKYDLEVDISNASLTAPNRLEGTEVCSPGALPPNCTVIPMSQRQSCRNGAGTSGCFLWTFESTDGRPVDLDATGAWTIWVRLTEGLMVEIPIQVER